MPVDWEQPADPPQIKEDPETVELRKKLEECKFMKNISILMA